MVEKSALRTRNPAIPALTTSWVCFSVVLSLKLPCLKIHNWLPPASSRKVIFVLFA